MDDINPQRRQELEAHKALLEPILAGLRDRSRTIISDDLKAAFDHQIIVKQRRLDAVNNQLEDMDRANASYVVLLEDGYPALLPVALEQALWDELQKEDADLAASSAIFRADQATSISVTLGGPEDKPTA